MDLGFGTDFRSGLKQGLYVAKNQQPLWLAALMLIVLFVVTQIIQSLFALAVWPFLPDQSAADFIAALQSGQTPSAELMMRVQTGFAKAALIGLLPGAVLTAFVAWWLAKIYNPGGDRGIPLHMPKLGVAGWVCVILGLLVFVGGTTALIFWVLGIDPATYAATKDGLNDNSSAAGMVEKIMADLSDEPLLFALALPGIVIGAPLAEEIVFRGAIFSRLRQSWFGNTGAVVVTAAIWSVVHGFAAPWLFVFIIFIMGLALGWILLRFGSLTLTIVCHGCWNLVSSLTIFSGAGLP
jgi:uncharacterized protein